MRFCGFHFGLNMKDDNYGTWSMGFNLVLKTMALKSIESKKNLQPYHFVWNPKSNAIGKMLQGCLWKIFVKFLKHFCTIEFLCF
jgi:hypothetical protein